MPHPCDHPTYAPYAEAVRVVFNTDSTAADIATMQRLKAVWMEAVNA